MITNDNPKRLVFIGDSLTACAKYTNNHGPLGCGYVSLLADMLAIRNSHTSYNLTNNGINDNTIGHLLSRWADDVYSYYPDVLVVQIGINDALRFMAKSSSYHLPPQQFGETYARLVSDTKATLPEAKILLIEPFYPTTGKNPAGSYRNDFSALVAQYIAKVREVATTHDVKLYAPEPRFRQILKHKPANLLLTDDYIHLTRVGHLVLAEDIYAILFSGVSPCST